MITQPRDFVIIDDDPINNKICKRLIEQAFPESAIADFTNPSLGFKYIAETYSSGGNSCILLLDINMPGMSGWDFLNVFETLDPKLKQNVTIYILSSSINRKDMDRAKENNHVMDYLVKPLSKEKVELLAKTME